MYGWYLLELGISLFLLIISYRYGLRWLSCFGEPKQLVWLGVWVVGYIADLIIIANSGAFITTRFIATFVYLPLLSFVLSIWGHVNRMDAASRKSKANGH